MVVLRVRDINLHADIHHNEITFSYQGLNNDRIRGRYVLAITEFAFEESAVLLGDGFQMLAQTTGTVDNPITLVVAQTTLQVIAFILRQAQSGIITI